MPTIKQHRPNFFSGFENKIKSFETLEELLAIDFVQNFANQDNFHQFSVEEIGNMLMAEYDGGATWYVVGYFSNDVSVSGGDIVRESPWVEIDLPIWDNVEAMRLKEEKEKEE
jgi:hypothetical protein